MSQEFSQGGGFMGSSSQKSRSELFDSVRPVTLKQLTEAASGPGSNDEEIKIDDVPVGKVSIVATIRKVTGGQDSAPTVYRLEDGTSTYEVRKFNTGPAPMAGDDDEEEEQKQPEFHEGDSVKVIGTARINNEKQVITVQAMIKITDFNEIIYHQLNAIAVHLYNTRGPPPSGDGGNKNGDDSLFVQNGNSGNDLQSKILNAIRVETASDDSGDGVHSDKIVVKLGEANRQAILQELENMEGNGEIFCPQENHYSIAE